MDKTMDTGHDRRLHRRPARVTAATGGIALAALAVLLMGIAQVAGRGSLSSIGGTAAAASQDVVGRHHGPVTDRAEAAHAPARGAQAEPEHGDADDPLPFSSEDLLARIDRDAACVALTTSLLSGSMSYLTCLYRPDDGLILLADPLIDGNVDLLGIAASANDSRSLSLTGGAVAFGGTCIVGFTPLGTADTESASDPNGTSSTTRGNGTLPVTLVELAHVSVPTEPGERPTAGAAAGVAVTPDGDARSSGTVTRDGADSETETSDPGLAEDVSVHSEDVLDDTDELPLGTALSPNS